MFLLGRRAEGRSNRLEGMPLSRWGEIHVDGELATPG